jgi:dTDP-4-dehydrorhamnose reductase
LIIGGSGFLGAELIRQAAAAGQPTVATYATSPGNTARVAWHHLDLRDPGHVDAVMTEVRPHLIVNASSGGADWAVTAQGPVRLAIAAAKCGSRLVHVSSDAVFSGSRDHYDESCLPDPVTPYGAAKAAAETGVLLVHPQAVVARTSLIIGGGRSVHEPTVHERTVHELAAGTREGADHPGRPGHRHLVDPGRRVQGTEWRGGLVDRCGFSSWAERFPEAPCDQPSSLLAMAAS